jgi:protocatechuate 3,4-dioxygenase beta subunit
MSMSATRSADRHCTRRRLLAALGALGVPPLLGLGTHPSEAATARAASDTSCVLSPVMTEGPFFVDERLNRSDLVSGSSKPAVVQGLPLTLDIQLRKVTAAGCLPVAGLQVDIWHCDAVGEYSDVAAGMGQSGSKGQAFLRGYQVSDANGRAKFTTIYPGWYPGRAIHIHVKARAFDGAGNTTYDFTTQLFFDDAVSDAVMSTAPYNARGSRRTRNANEAIYANQSSALLQLDRPADGGRGYVATIALGLKP